MTDYEFESDFGQLLDNFTFSNPQFEELGDDFEDFLGGDKGLQEYQTLGGLDAVYYPTSKIDDEDTLLASLEEKYHIEQLRTYAAGWQLESQLVTFNHLVESFLNDDLPFKRSAGLQCLEFSLAKYKAYLESVRIPLEYQARIRFILSLVRTEEGPLEETGLWLLPDFPLDEMDFPDLPQLHDLASKISLNNDALLSILIEYCLDEDFSTPPFFSHDRPNVFAPRTWIRRVAENIERYDEDKSPKAGIIPLTVQSLLEVPARLALNPIQGLESSAVQESEKRNLFPDQRFFTLFQDVLLEIPKQELADTIARAIESDDLQEAIKVPGKFICKKLKESGEFDFVNSYYNAEEFRKSAANLLENTYPSLPSSMKLPPLLPLRPIPSLPDPSETCDLITDSPGPSVQIFKQKTGTETKFSIDLPNQDIISKYFLNQLKLFYKGIKLLKREDKLAFLDLDTRQVKFDTKERTVLYLKIMPEDILGLHLEKELAKSMGLPDWPLDNEKLSSFLNLPQKEVDDSFGTQRYMQSRSDINESNKERIVQEFVERLPLESKHLKNIDSKAKFHQLAIIMVLWSLLYQLKRQQRDSLEKVQVAVKSLRKILSAFMDANVMSHETSVTLGPIVFSQYKEIPNRVIEEEIKAIDSVEGKWNELLKEIKKLTKGGFESS